MATSITQLDDKERGLTVLRVEGEVTIEDAKFLERICNDLRETEPEKNIVIDLADIDFLDSESASILREINKHGIGIEGVHFFVQSVIEQVEKAGH